MAFITLRRLRAFLGLSLLLAGVAHAQPQYALQRTVPLPGEGGWDALTFEPGAGRLFIAHGKQVDVIDTALLRRVGTIDNTPGVHGIAIAPELQRGYISAGAANSVVVFDLKTLARVADIKTSGDIPDDIRYDPATQRVFTFNGGSNNVTVIDARSNAVIGTIALAGRPEFAVVAGQGRIYVNVEDKNSIAVIDTRDLKVLEVWPIAGCEEPSGLAFDAAEQRLIAACDNHIAAVVDAHSGRTLGSVAIAGGPDGAAYDAGARLAFVPCGEGQLIVIALSGEGVPQVVQSVPTARGARTMALDERSHRVYLVTADFGEAPPPTAEHPHPRPSILPGTFKLLVVEPHPQKVTMKAPGSAP